MSDFLTNLVIRSFASTASFQPVGASSYPGPQMFEDPGEEFSESVVESPAEEGSMVPPRAHRAANRSKRREAHSEATPVNEERSLELPLTVPGITTPPVASEPRPITEPRPPEPELPSVSPPKVTNATDTRSATRETASARSASPPPVTNTPEPRSTKRETTSAKPASTPPKTSSEDQTLPVVGPVSKEKTNEVEMKLGTPPSDVGAASRGILQRHTPIQPNEDATTVQRAPLDPQPSIRHLLKRPGNALSLSPQISSSSLERADSPITQEADPKGPESRVERPTAPFEQKQQTITSLTTLIPKISTQPFLPLNVRTRPIAPAREEHDEPAVAPLQETVINVAIGRIEVRATSAPAPKRERHANGPKVMNLDDYLQQRRGAT